MNTEIPKQMERIYVERPKFGQALLQQVEPSLRPYRENPKTKEYSAGIDATFFRFGNDFLPIPRPSGEEDEIDTHLKKQAEGKGWYAEIDMYKNIGMVIPATPGHEKDRVLLCHFHTDLVAAAGKNAATNPEIDPIEPTVVTINDEQWIQAKDNTTLGADDGAGAAAIIQAAADMAEEKDAEGNPIPHGPILLFGTSREEIGLEGMADFVKENTFNPEGEFAKLLPAVARILNSDGEQIDRLTIGSLGGELFKGQLHVAYQPLPEGYEYMQITLDGFRGGHSGKYAANPAAISTLAELLQEIGATDVRVASIATRNKFDNALAEDAEIVLAVPEKQQEKLRERVIEHGKALQQKYTDDPFTISVETPSDKPTQVMDAESSYNTLNLLTQLGALQGVAVSSEVFGDDLLERAMNIGVVKTKENIVSFLAFSRIRKDEMFGEYAKELDTIAANTGVTYNQASPISVWKPNFSRITDYEKTQRLYEETFGQKPRFEFAPGGMEMSIFDEVYPTVLKISNGVTIIDAHKAGERMLARTLAEVYIWNRKILAMWRDEINDEVQTSHSSRRVA